MSVLIVADPWDVHVRAVAWALRQRNIDSAVWYTHDYPQKHAASFEIGAEQALTSYLYCAHKYQSFAVTADTVWLRRWYRPEADPSLHPADVKFAQNEANEFVQSMMHALNDGTRFWVNPLQAKLRADRKPVQLAAARAVGLRIPETLISNEPARIRAFFDRHHGRIIYKPMTAASWRSETETHVSYTAPVTAEVLAEDAALSNAPAIYQTEISKAFELRVTLIGRTLFAARLESQQSDFYKTDWRANMLTQNLRTAPFTLPPAIAERCLALADALGVVFGCLDLIVTPDDEYVFLEINEMGQFLWVEEENEAFPLLDCFVKFLISRDPAFRYQDGDRQFSLQAYMASPDGGLDRLPAPGIHVPPPAWFHMQES